MPTQRTIPRDALAALRTRFLELVTEDPVTGCLEWPGPLHASGYVRVAVGQRYFSGARLAWLLLRPRRPLALGTKLWRRPGCSPRCIAPGHRGATPSAAGGTLLRFAPLPPPPPKPPKRRKPVALSTLARKLCVTVVTTNEG